MNTRQTLGLAFILASVGTVFSQATLAVEYAVAHQACHACLQATAQHHDEISDDRELKRLVCYPKGATIEDGAQPCSPGATRRPGMRG
ncbi:hypothetical protein [Thiorhodococcus minor]|uniref:Secreted protein n=1 Tax=Thiorhodococcus minor TaxID=57489 RepID=A0A6M0JYZ9_9GAMM|nr:hypothetical protein [Thiorhodococcus minor]NEV61325.1 hypothetical protein [Thiorhodococcus minor]